MQPAVWSQRFKHASSFKTLMGLIPVVEESRPQDIVYCTLPVVVNTLPSEKGHCTSLVLHVMIDMPCYNLPDFPVQAKVSLQQHNNLVYWLHWME